MVVDEKIARIDVAVVLDHHVMIADAPKGTHRLPLPHTLRQHGVEIADGYPPKSVFRPEIKDLAQEFAEFLRRDAVAVTRLDAGNELQVEKALIDIPAQQIGAHLDVLVVHDAEDVELDPVAVHEPGRLHHLVPGASSRPVYPETVMHGLRTVQAQADKKLVFAKETAPLRVEQYPVGLQGVSHTLARGAVLFLKLDGPPEEIEPAQGRFAALPGKDRLGKAVLEQIADHLLLHILRHDVARRPGIQFLGAQVETILAAQVAVRARGLDQQLKWSWRSHAASVSNWRTFAPKFRWRLPILQAS